MNKKTRYVVKEVSICGDCYGHGWITTGIWNRYYDWAGAYENAHDGQRPLPAEDETWWLNAGYSKPPDEEKECSVCQGSGKIEIEIDLQTALAKIGVWSVRKSELYGELER
jgi:hypothetical protein